MAENKRMSVYTPILSCSVYSTVRAKIMKNTNLSVLTVLLLCFSLASINLFTLHSTLTPLPETQPLPKPK